MTEMLSGERVRKDHFRTKHLRLSYTAVIKYLESQIQT